MFLIDWLFWCVISYKSELLICALIVREHAVYDYGGVPMPWEVLPLQIVGAMSLWIVYCLLRQGYAVG